MTINCRGGVSMAALTCTEKFVTSSFENATSTSVAVRFEFTSGCPGRLCYYPTAAPNQIQYSNPEDTNTFSTHVQTVQGLAPGTAYAFIIQTRCEPGEDWSNVSEPVIYNG